MTTAQRQLTAVVALTKGNSIPVRHNEELCAALIDLGIAQQSKPNGDSIYLKSERKAQDFINARS